GVLSFAMAESGRYYTSEDLALSEELGYRASLAIDNALLYHASEAARKAAQQAKAAAEKAAVRTARLQAVTAALSESLTPSQVAEVIAEQGVMALGATSALIALLTENGTELEVVRALDIDQALSEAWHRFSINAPVPLAQAVRTGKPLWPEPTAARIARYPHLAREYNQVNYGAWISIPLMLEGRAVGGMSFSFTQTTDFSEDDQAFTLTLAQQCAQALERARLYAVSEEARRAAETANRTKDEFLATLSHELRTPLNAMLGWTQLLRTRKLDEVTTVRAIETIDRNTKSLATLIEDVLDVSRIITGKLRLDVRPIELAPVIEAAIDAVRSAAEAKGIRIESQLHPLVGIVLADPDRLQQVAWNLLSNAIKFTPQGGKVEVQLEIVDRLAGWQVDGSNQPANLQPSTHAQSFNPCVQLRVSDTGKGINPDFLPYVFERFSQADSTTTRAYGGLGLGLAIVRHLVDMHGGTVRAESAGEGQGATFIVNLPRVSDY
ncbi:MAG: HAMP domain-containing histidine kinase, partial [Coleofasciculus sp. Co-bin14]|nr:HAMP domain-containing histidine kinase [Coleofasciculus sp. Co-bin14]